MTNEEARKIFDSAIIKASYEGRDISGLEIAREYFTNPEFRQWLSNVVWASNQ